LVHPSPAGDEQLPDGVAALDLVATELVRGPLALTATTTATTAGGAAAALGSPDRGPPGRGGASRGRWAPTALLAAASGLAATSSASASCAHRGSSRSTMATAQQAMPSWRPRAPRPSGRLPFTVTGPPAASLSRCC